MICFEEAVRLDPNFAWPGPPWRMLSDSLWSLITAQRETLSRAREYAERAVSLDPNTSGSARHFRHGSASGWEWDRAKVPLRRL